MHHPTHYNSHPSGIEVIEITQWMGFCLGNAVKYILRCDYKGNAIQDLEKARWYIDREIQIRKQIAATQTGQTPSVPAPSSSR